MREIQEWLDRTDPESYANGITGVDLLDLPASLNAVMRLILANVSIAERTLEAAVAALPPDQRPDGAELALALDALCARRWVSRSADDGQVCYRANLHTRDTQARKRPKVWDALDLD